ncbi:MAG: IS5 family transposase [Flavobacteriaceae bacterium]|nr:IS5 family transposase [Flavobacteriaceae bacterium]
MKKVFKKRAPTPSYISPSQLTMDCFQSPFEQELNPTNRWVVLSRLMPWDEVCNLYLKNVGVSPTGRPPLSPRVIIGSMIIKHLCNLDDRETVDQISENIYMQYFLGYSSFSSAPPFDASLFVDFRKRLSMENMNAINERIVFLKTKLESKKNNSEPPSDQDRNDSAESENKGRVIFDATACPQDISYPTDLDLISESREKTEQLIDLLYNSGLHQNKPRTYRRIARKRYLKTAQKKNKSRKEIRKSVGSQLRFLRRNLISINRLLDAYPQIPLKPKQHKYLLVVNTLYVQQKQMYDSKTHSVEDRIVSIHQPHVRPIVRGKSQAKVEFGAKIHVSIIDGISFLDELSWDAFNEGSHMMDYVEQYRKRFGCYPKELLADQIYCTRANRAALKEKGIKLLAKPLGRPSAVPNHVSPGERNPIEGKFGQAKTGYGLNRIKARLRVTSESWIACIFLVLNLVKLAGAALPCLIVRSVISFSAKEIFDRLGQNADQIKVQIIFYRQILNLYPIKLKIPV